MLDNSLSVRHATISAIQYNLMIFYGYDVYAAKILRQEFTYDEDGTTRMMTVFKCPGMKPVEVESLFDTSDPDRSKWVKKLDYMAVSGGEAFRHYAPTRDSVELVNVLGLVSPFTPVAED